MKKKVLGIVAAVAVVAIAGVNYLQQNKSIELSDLALENVEAPASDESSSRRYQTMGYCTPSDLNYMCTSRKTAEACRRHCP